MSADDARIFRPLAGISELVQKFREASKPRAAWRIGGEHEKIGIIVDPAFGTPGAAVPYAGERGSITAMLRDLTSHGWTPLREGEHVIALTREHASITLEPGGQFELSGAPHGSLLALEGEFDRHREEVRAVATGQGAAFLAVGFRPLGTLDDVPWVPKGRYAIMREYLPTRGGRALEMMKRTATVQANLDWSDEADAHRKFVAAMSVTSLVTAIYANSPVVDGRDTGWQSWRASIWLDTDPDRCGIPPFSFSAHDDDFFLRYTEWALDVPMFFVYREAWGGYHKAGGMTFRRFLREGFEGERATLADWQLHLSTLFPETRIKGYLEVRGADAGPQPLVLALPALWKGLLYDDAAMAAATALTAHLSYEERLALRAEVPHHGFATPVRAAGGGHVKKTRVLELARELVAIARGGLSRVEAEELPLLAPLEEIVKTGRAPAERVREAFAGWGGDVTKLVDAIGF
jgi:glutamate--cysteine ligase